MGGEKRDMNTLFLKIGFAFAFSVGGMLFSVVRNKRIINSSKSPSDPSARSSDCDDQEISRSSTSNHHHHHHHHASHKTPNSCRFDPLATDKQKFLSDKDYYLLPEFNDLVKEFDLPVIKTSLDPAANPPPKVNSAVKTDSQEQEIKNLHNIVKNLKERERNLEMKLLENYGLKEQETAVKELQNRIRLSNMEAKLFALKIESLQTDNKMLQSQMADYSKVLADLESARAMIKVLKKKLRLETAQNKERILDLQQRVENMQEDEHRIDPEVELKLCKLKNLEAEVIDLRMSNNNLQVEKSELIKRLEHVQILTTSVLEEDQKTQKLRTEHEQLKKQNAELTNEIEQLQADRCSDAEELVYLRWINACLRYELRNHPPEPGKTTARDLSKTLSPKSEQKAKKLILEYANEERDCITGLNIPELDSDHWSSPPSSNPGDLDEHSIDYSSCRKKKNYKFFGKLVKFLRVKDGNSRNSSLERTESIGEEMNSSMDSQRLNYRNSLHKRIDSIAEGDGEIDDGLFGSPSSSDGKKSELVKFAEVLNGSNTKPPTRYRRRSAPFSSF